ncbi:MAG: hypothetical protein A3J55_02855 [Candidatus Ryanbacteria bacterium RIFCSPHIGHO2_02_FULL_45_17b]|uniref:Uncharacterized protein n=1 Tax=Candidatus Ryanbacteria bacterium RIFCSPHIGHO2_01_FULL_45_22 TaxID=1802114 RepID=A0A1G2FZD1_9BACT|nr:MAG: hypothetical protein A2719_05605 [Candidatus Ryanbacteria bacterium RIFCSPHIGHO2_01_FULL_45_22]OGZ47351.1 MAG: hypothetical protein A3J55_02855 [Candidatus Ryanbacteria bacterium RIFCSPHIGHO2_02_FULL_45_17b]
MENLPSIFQNMNPFDKPVFKTGDKWAFLTILAVLFGGLGLGFLWYLPTILSFLIWAAANTILAIALIVVAAGLLTLVSNGQFRTSLRYKFRGLARVLTRIFVRSDPVGAMRGYLHDLDGQIDKLSMQERIVRKRLLILGDRIRDWVTKLDTAARNYQHASKGADKNRQFVQGRQADRLENSLQRFIRLWVGLKRLSLFLVHAAERAKTIREDCGNQIEVTEAELQEAKAASTAAQSAFRVLRGNPDQRAIYEMALEEAAGQVGANVADMRYFMDVSQNMLDAAGTDDTALAERGVKLLEDWQNRGASFVLEAQFTKITDADFTEDLAALGINREQIGTSGGKKPSAYKELFGSQKQ